MFNSDEVENIRQIDISKTQFKAWKSSNTINYRLWKMTFYLSIKNLFALLREITSKQWKSLLYQLSPFI